VLCKAWLHLCYTFCKNRHEQILRSIRIYQAGQYDIGQTIELSAAASQHVGVVLRMQLGESLTLFNGDNYEFPAIISSVHKKKIWVAINAKHEVSRESPRAIHLAQAISKGDRMEFVIQKAVELGVASITPLFTSRCVVRLDADRLAKKQLQWEAIAIAACEQSGRNQLPAIHPACSLDSYIQQCQASIKLVLDPRAQTSWRDFNFSSTDIALLIGPEGGLSDDEVDLTKASGFNSLSLGPRILRTETAAIAALSVLQAIAGDL